jgi:hypothetical protein
MQLQRIASCSSDQASDDDGGSTRHGGCGPCCQLLRAPLSAVRRAASVPLSRARAAHHTGAVSWSSRTQRDAPQRACQAAVLALSGSGATASCQSAASVRLLAAGGCTLRAAAAAACERASRATPRVLLAARHASAAPAAVERRLRSPRKLSLACCALHLRCPRCSLAVKIRSRPPLRCVGQRGRGAGEQRRRRRYATRSVALERRWRSSAPRVSALLRPIIPLALRHTPSLARVLHPPDVRRGSSA